MHPQYYIRFRQGPIGHGGYRYRSATGGHHDNGQPGCVVTMTGAMGFLTMADAEAHGRQYIALMGAFDILNSDGIAVKVIEPAGATPLLNPLLDALAKVQDLEERLKGAQEQIKRLDNEVSATMAKHRADIAAISERLIAEAEDRDWCDTYDDVIKDLNQELNVKLKVRVQPYVVDTIYTVTVRTTVTATDEDEAINEVENMTPEDGNAEAFRLHQEFAGLRVARVARVVCEETRLAD